jgi:hypothetical protein
MCKQTAIVYPDGTGGFPVTFRCENARVAKVVTAVASVKVPDAFWACEVLNRYGHLVPHPGDPVTLREKEPMTNEIPVSVRLEQLLKNRFGDNFRVEIPLTVRAELLYWLVNLAEAGIEARRRAWKAAPGFGAAEAASLASWRLDLENLLAKVEAALAPPPDPLSYYGALGKAIREGLNRKQAENKGE